MPQFPDGQVLVLRPGADADVRNLMRHGSPVTWHERTLERLRELLIAQDFPKIEIRRAVTVPAGETPWLVFLKNPSLADAAEAVDALERRAAG